MLPFNFPHHSESLLPSAILSALTLVAAFLAPSAFGADYFLARSAQNPQDDNVLEPGKVYDGSSADRVDDFMRKVPEGGSIHLGPYVFDTRGLWDNWLNNQTQGFRLKSGWTITGAGTNSVGGTTMRLADVVVDKTTHYNANTVFSTGGIGLYGSGQPQDRRPNVNYVIIRDLQIDCNYDNLARLSGTPELQLAGIQILGNRGLKVINVLVLNGVSKKLSRRSTQYENFQVYCYNIWASDPPGDYFIDRVAVGNYHGGYTSAICVNGNATGVIQNCTVDLASDNAQRYGLNFAGGVHHFNILSNTIHNSTRAINNDTGPVCTNMRIADNRIVNCSTGMLLANSRSNLVANNDIQLDGTGSGIMIRYHPLLDDVKSSACIVRGNRISAPGGEGIALCYQNEYDPADQTLYWSTNNVVQSNVLSAALQSKIPPYSIAPNIVQPGNRRLAASRMRTRSVTASASVSAASENLVAVGFPADTEVAVGRTYCVARAFDSSSGYIARVRLQGTGLDMKSDWGDGTGYSDFTTGYPIGTKEDKGKRSYYVQWADVQQAHTYRLDIYAGAPRNPRPANFVVYIDYNQDGTFSERELVGTGWGKNFASIDVVVPRNAALGSTRMRVMMAGGLKPMPCEKDTFWGEVEDYTINVLPKNGAPPQTSLTVPQ